MSRPDGQAIEAGRGGSNVVSEADGAIGRGAGKIVNCGIV